MRRDADERGMTLIETIVAAGIAALIVGVLGSTVFLLTRTTEQGNDELNALQDVQNAGYWLTRDGKMADSTDLIGDAAPVSSVTLSWDDGGQNHTVTYSLSGTELKRDYDGNMMTVARHVSSVGFSISGGVITATVTSSPDGRWQTSEETTYKITPRPT
jgi:type II secretory pathway pseudopilin PulG